jgi:hypothetical protein
MARRRGAETMRLRVTVEVEPERALRLEAHLYKVLEVRSVEARSEPRKDGCKQGVTVSLCNTRNQHY